MQPSDRLKFVLAGNATFTIVSRKTGARYTYKAVADKRPAQEQDLHFVSVLTSPDTYTFLGTVFERRAYRHESRSSIGREAPSALAFGWFFDHPETDSIEFYHAGKCGRCGRELTVPESIESGLGPECARRMG